MRQLQFILSYFGRRLLLPLTFLVFHSTLSGQCSLDVNDCATAIPMACSSVTYSLVDESPIGFYYPGCPGWSIDNPYWFSFEVAVDGAISILVNPVECEGSGAGGGLGMQAALYAECDTSSIPDTSYTALAAQCACTNDSILFELPNVSAGTYLLMVDGCAADVCDFEIVVSPNFMLPLGDIEQPICSDTTPCPGTIVTFTLPLVSNATFYNWEFPQGVTLIGSPPRCDSVAVIWGATGGCVRVEAGNECGSTQFSPEICLTVPHPEGYDTTYICGLENSPCGQPICEMDIPWITNEGCDSTIHLTTIVHDTSLTIISSGPVFCEGDPGITDTIEVLSNQFGCDSTIIYNPVIHPGFYSLLKVHLCEGDSFQGQIYFIDTVLVDSLLTTEGCDSVFVTNIKVAPHYDIQIDTTLMMGDSYDGLAIFSDTTIIKELESQAGCDSVVTINIMITTVGTDHWPTDNCRIEVYPVPAGPVLYLRTNHCSELKISALYNAQGQNVWQADWWNETSRQVSIEALPPGGYYLQVQEAKNTRLLKFVKLH